MAFLAACESGSIDDTYLDNLISLQGILLVLGVADVVVTQWPVSDLACALFARKFYMALGRTHDVGRSVFESATWLRRCTATDVVDFLRTTGAGESSLKPSDRLAFPDLWYWAPFVHYRSW
jgi:CHAT domain-containing protein